MTPNQWTMANFNFLRRFDPKANTSEELLKVASAAAKDIFYKKGEIVSGTFMFDNPPGGFTSAVEIPWRNNSEKHSVSFAFKKMLETIGLERYAVLSEVWFYTEGANDRSVKDMIDRDLTPSQRPDRREGVMVLVRDRTDNALIDFLEIKRRINSRPMLIPVKNGLPANEFIDMTFGKLYATKSS